MKGIDADAGVDMAADAQVPDRDAGQPDGNTGAGMLSLFAGTLGGAGNADGIGQRSAFNSPQGVTSDGAGNLYIADANNDTIRKLVIATGEVSTLAGAAGQAGTDDGVGAAARFSGPGAIVSDGAGNLYVSDTLNSTIRKVVIATGAVTTIAGGPNQPGDVDGTGTAARFLIPEGIATDGVGNLYVADTGNHTIRAVVAATGVVTTLAGTGGQQGTTDGTGAAARFYQPQGIVADGSGNLYVSDTENRTLRKVVIASGEVTTFAGAAGQPGSTDGAGAAARFLTPGALTIDGASLFLTDISNCTIRKVDLVTTSVTTVAGSAGQLGYDDGAGHFYNPQGIAADGVGHLYVADTGNNTVRKVVIATGAITTIVGTAAEFGSADGARGTAQFNNDVAIASDGSHLYVADSGNETIREVVLATNAVTTLAGTAGQVGSVDGTGPAATFRQPQGVALDNAGNLYVADTDNQTIRKVVIATGVVTTLAGTAGQSGSADGTGAAARFSIPTGLASDGAALYVADNADQTIRKIVLGTGAVTTLAGSAGQAGNVDGSGAAARFNGPMGLAVDGSGNLYVADEYNNSIRKVVLATGAVTTLVGNAPGSADGTGSAARFDLPLGIALDGPDTLYVVDSNNDTLRKVALATRAVTTVVGVAGHGLLAVGALPASLSLPSGGIAATPDQGIFLTDQCAVLVVR